MNYSKKIILTGASGLIGKQAISFLLNDGFEIYAITSKNPPDSTNQLQWVQADLFNHKAIDKLFAQIAPEYLLHFAWCASGDYLISDDNYKFLESSLNLLKAFQENGGKKVVMAGTCFEYAFKNISLLESDALDPQTPYAKCKNELREKAEKFCLENDLSFTWGRIFYVYGENENELRLTPQVINSLKNDKKIVIGAGPLIKDYIYTKDIAAAFVKTLQSDVKGCVNICTGEGITIKDYTKKIAEKLGKEHLLEFKDNCSNQPQIFVGDNTKLKNEVGYEIKYSLDEALSQIIRNK